MKKSNQKEARFRRILGNLLIVLGCVLIGGILFINLKDYYRSIAAIDEFSAEKTQYEHPDVEVIIDDEDKASLSEDEYDVTQVVPQVYDRTYAEGELVCLLRIPRIELTEAVREGSTRDVLSSALGHMEDTANPGKDGNCCIAGHRNYVFGKYFNRLNELESGDIIELETLEDTYHYSVVSTEVIRPEQIEVLDYEEGYNLTLITCTPLFVGSHRLIIHAELVQ